MSSSRRRVLFERVALLAGSSLVGLLLMELALSIVDLPRSVPFLQEFHGTGFKVMAYDANPSGCLDIELRDPQRRDAIAARFVVPEQRRAFEEHWSPTPFAVEVDFNSAGFRENEFQPKPEGVRRIVIVGDSFSYGHGLPNADSYPRQLERLLQRRDPAQRVEVYNAARGGFDLDAIAPVAAMALRDLDPDVLVYGYFLNDPLRRTDAAGAEIEPMLDTAWLRREREGSRFSLGGRDGRGLRLPALVRDLLHGRRLTADTLAWYQRIHEPAAWAPTARAIERMQRSAREGGVDFLLLVLPVIWQLDGEDPLADVHRRIVEHAERHGIDVLDLHPVLAGRADTELFLHPQDRHPNCTYTRLVAEAVAEVL